MILLWARYARLLYITDENNGYSVEKFRFVAENLLYLMVLSYTLHFVQRLS